MKLLIVTDSYYPSNNSVAVMLGDLVQAFKKQSIDMTVLLPSSDQDSALKSYWHEGCEIISVRGLKTKDISYFRRTLNEFINPWLIWLTLRIQKVFKNQQFDGIIWYSPTIFWGPLIKRLKAQSACQSYLILRDIFPDWAMHLGLLRPGLVYWFFKRVEHYQYQQADCIGVQSPNNLKYFQAQHPDLSNRTEVLWNWVPRASLNNTKECSINLNATPFKDKVIFVYTGNLGIAQGGSLPIIALAHQLKKNSNIGILIVGRGTAINDLRDQIASNEIANILVFDEIDVTEIPALLKQCDVGMVFLDRRHQTQNIPGKFLTYLQSYLPVLAWVNPGNDLIDLINNYNLGTAYSGDDIEKLSNMFNTMALQVSKNQNLINVENKYLDDLFSPDIQAQQIIKFLNKEIYIS